MTPEELARLVAAAVQLASVLWTWIADEDHGKPVTASAVALATMLRAHPELRAELVAKCAANPVLREQLIDLCDAYAEDWPIFLTMKDEVQHAAG